MDKKLKSNNIKGKLSDDSITSNSREPCELDIRAPPSIKVKQERPSPMMECGLCMHPPRSPHTPQCSFSFGIAPTPVAMIPGTPRPLSSVPPQRPVPHLPSSALPTMFKQERQAGTYLNLEHINRPSSEERPKNPAPPDTATDEPPSPLPIPSPHSTLHPPPPPRPLMFSEEQFVEPPRPPSPPPPQHSPRIKIERQTPQFICCCMRNECERSNSSRQSADFRRGSSTPQGQLCESAALRATPHSVFKYDPSYISGLRARTPHNAVLNIFSTVAPSNRCLSSSNGTIMPGIVPNHCLNVGSNDSNHNAKVNVGVQTEKISQQYIPNVACIRPVTPSLPKTDQTTSTDDLGVSRPDSHPLESDISCANETRHIRGERDGLNSFVSTSAVPDSRTPSLINTFTGLELSGNATMQLIQLNNYEREIFGCLDVVEKQERELAKERKRLREFLHRIHEIRHKKLLHQQSSTLGNNEVSGKDIKSFEDAQQNSERVSNGQTNDLHDCNISNNSNNNNINNNNHNNNNSSLVSSSQEGSIEFQTSVVNLTENINNSQILSVQGEGCSSTSLPRENLYVRESSDSEEETEDIKNFCMKSSSQYRIGKPCFLKRKRLNSCSTSDEYQEPETKDESHELVKALADPLRENNSNNVCCNNDSVVNASSSAIRKGEDAESNGMECQHERNALIKEHEHICSLAASNRKGSVTGSPQSPKMRNSSGSEHGYSLRSRGPPSDLFDFNSDSQLSKDTLISSQDEHLEISMEKQLTAADKNEDEQADDEFERDDVESRAVSKLTSPNEGFKKRKRKRKTKYHMNKCKKKKDLNVIYSNAKQGTDCSLSNTLKVPKKEMQNDYNEQDKDGTCKLSFISLKEDIKTPPSHSSSVLDLKVVGSLIFTASMDGTARIFDPASGVVLSTYQSHSDSVTSIQVIGEPQFSIGSPRFLVVTGSEDCSVHVYDGKTGVLTQRRNCTEPVRCLEYRWGYLFIGTDGGCGIKWNLKDKKLGEKIQFCGKGITRILTHIEGGRKVLVVGAKTTPIMVRDAMSGLFLRTLEYVQLTMYAAVFEGSLLYTGGTDKRIFVYDFCGGTVKEEIYSEASVSGLILVQNYLVATCYDGYVRIFRLPKGDLIHTVQVESSHKMFICSALFRNKILLGNKNGDIVSCDLPKLDLTTQ